MHGGTPITYTPNRLNQYTSLTGTVTASPTYDNNGNMLTDGLGATMTWDAENRMASWEKGTDKLEFVYDGMGRRVEKRKLVNSVVTETTRYVYDGLLPVAHLDGTNARTVELSRGMDLSESREGAGGIGGLLAWTPSAQASEFYSYDGNGNVVDLLNTANAVVGHYEYSPFGEVVVSTGTSTNPYSWSSKEEDETSNLVYYLYRYYESSLGRWINRDPIEENGGDNLYAMVANNPINIFDAYGLQGISPGPPSRPKLPQKSKQWWFDQAVYWGGISQRLPKLFLRRYIWGGGDYKLTSSELAYEVKPHFSLMDSPKFRSDLAAASGRFSGTYKILARDSGHRTAGLGKFAMDVHVEGCIRSGDLWRIESASGKMVPEMWDFDWKFVPLVSELIEKAVNGSYNLSGRELRTFLGSFIPGKSFKISAEDVDIRQNNFDNKAHVFSK